VIPIVLRFKYGVVSPAYDVAPFFGFFPLSMCLYGDFSVEVLELPPFKPNEHLFRTHRDRFSLLNHSNGAPEDSEPERWEVFAWAIRDIMSKAGGLPLNNQPYREKLEYEHLLGFRESLPSRHK